MAFNRPISTLRALLFSPVHIASLAVFRIAFGTIMLWEVLRYFSYGWIARLWIEPTFHFTYPGFHWVHPWPGDGMYIHMAALGVLAAFIAAGLFYHASAALFFLGFTYTFLLEHALYLNHLYFVCLISSLMIFLPAHRAYSVDAWRRPSLRAEIIPFWPIWLLRAQLAIVYFYAGVAKLNSDWFEGEPLRTWLHTKSATPIVGPLFDWPATFYLIAWGGLAFDLFIVPFLLWKRTRAAAFIIAVCFHLLNVWFFRIGIFPWFSIAMTTVFLEPDWPVRLWNRLTRKRHLTTSELPTTPPMTPLNLHQHRVLTFVGLYIAIQVLLPLRHWIYPGDVAWTEEGHQFSWRMKLRDKEGDATFIVTNPATGETWHESADAYLEPWQTRKMVNRPELIRQFTHHLAALKSAEVGTTVEVRVQSIVRLNHREPGVMIDPQIDLSKEPHRIGPAKWIVRQPVPGRPSGGG